MQLFALAVLLIGITFASAFTGEQVKFQQEMLQRHNDFRLRHCAAPLRLDDNLSRIAQDYADYLASRNLFQHSNNGYGENLYWSSSTASITSVHGAQATQSWYDEISSYNYNSPGFSAATGHFTQVVWKASTKLGVGIAFGNGRRSAYIVANYDPPGNYMGQFNQNVAKPNC